MSSFDYLNGEKIQLFNNSEIKSVVVSIFDKISHQKKYKSESIDILNAVMETLNDMNSKNTFTEKHSEEDE